MIDPNSPYEKLPDASRDAVHAAKNAAHALELSRQVQVEKTADATVSKISKSLGDILQGRLEHVLARGTEDEKSMVLARVPYICQDIRGISASLTEIKDLMKQTKIDLDIKDEKNEKRFVNQDQFQPFKWGLTIVASVFITTIIGALLASVIIKQ